MSRKKRDSRQSDGIDYWKSSSDMMTALILILLLVIMFLVLYILQRPDNDFTDYQENKYEDVQGEGGEGDDKNDNVNEHDGKGWHDDTNGGGGGNGDGDDEGDYPSEGEGKKSAVLVSMVDAETGKAIQEKGVTFELYSNSNALMVLNTYYPKKKSYREYETTAEGEFYLPEKIIQQDYYLHQLSELKGYDLTDKVEFSIDKVYDWPDPFLVKVPMYPKRDVIRIQMTDKEDGRAVPGGEFEVIATDDIVTQDDTVRVKKGERADVIKCDEKGYGESKRLYLGKYTVKQSVIPEYYASNDEPISVVLEDKRMKEEEKEDKDKIEIVTKEEAEKEDEESNPVNPVRAERTKITFVLTDELEGTSIAGASFDVTGPNVNERMTTDEAGQIILDDVEKNSTYEFAQIDVPGDYIASIEPVKVQVSAAGRIGKDAQADVIATNRMLRLEIGVRDAVLQNHLVDIKAELFTEAGKSVKAWTTNGAYTELTGLPEGKYYVNLNGDKSRKYAVNVVNTAQLQQFNIRIFTTKSYAAIGGAAVLLAVILVLIWMAMKKSLKMRAEAREKEKEEKKVAEAAEDKAAEE